jgi:hypothetical protein
VEDGFRSAGPLYGQESLPREVAWHCPSMTTTAMLARWVVRALDEVERTSRRTSGVGRIP